MSVMEPLELDGMPAPADVTDPTPAEPPKAKRGPGRPRGARTRTPKTPKGEAGDTTPKRGGRPTNTERLERQLAEQLAALGLMLSFKNRADGLTVVNRAPELAAAFAKLAEQNPRVRALLEGGLTGSAWVAVAMALGGLTVELVANHRAPADGPAPLDGIDLAAWANLANGAGAPS